MIEESLQDPQSNLCGQDLPVNLITQSHSSEAGTGSRAHTVSYRVPVIAPQNDAESLVLEDQTETCVAFKNKIIFPGLNRNLKNADNVQAGPTAPASQSCQMFTLVSFCPVLRFHS